MLGLKIWQCIKSFESKSFPFNLNVERAEIGNYVPLNLYQSVTPSSSICVEDKDVLISEVTTNVLQIKTIRFTIDFQFVYTATFVESHV